MYSIGSNANLMVIIIECLFISLLKSSDAAAIALPPFVSSSFDMYP